MVRCNLVAAPLGCLGRLLLLVTLLLTALAVVESHVGEVDETAMPDKQLGMAVQVCARVRGRVRARACVCVCVRTRALPAIAIIPFRRGQSVTTRTSRTSRTPHATAQHGIWH
jgi:hypothetical protein